MSQRVKYGGQFGAYKPGNRTELAGQPGRKFLGNCGGFSLNKCVVFRPLYSPFYVYTNNKSKLARERVRESGTRLSTSFIAVLVTTRPLVLWLLRQPTNKTPCVLSSKAPSSKSNRHLNPIQMGLHVASEGQGTRKETKTSSGPRHRDHGFRLRGGLIVPSEA